MSAPVFACARCGQRPRHDDTFLCAVCLSDPTTRDEQDGATETYPGDYREQRRFLTEGAKWAGWHRRMKGVPRA